MREKIPDIPPGAVICSCGGATAPGAGGGGSGRSSRGEKPRRPKSGPKFRTGLAFGEEAGVVSPASFAPDGGVVSLPLPGEGPLVVSDLGENFPLATGTPISLGTKPTITMT